MKGTAKGCIVQIPAHGRILTKKTICGLLIPESAEGVSGYFFRQVSRCQSELAGYVLDSAQPPSDEEMAGDPWANHNFMYRLDDAGRYICQVAQRLIEERDNPVHYGDNLPGWFDANHKPITPARFSFSDLISYGPSDPDTGDINGFLALCGAKSYEDLEIAAGLLSLDEAMQFSSTDLAYGFHLLGEAQTIEHYLELDRLRRELRGHVPEEALERAFSQKQSERARARDAKDSDGKQAVKAEVRECWQRWQAEPSRYPTLAAFAADMLEKYPDHLKNPQVVERWTRAWRAAEATSD